MRNFLKDKQNESADIVQMQPHCESVLGDAAVNILQATKQYLCSDGEEKAKATKDIEHSISMMQPLWSCSFHSCLLPCAAACDAATTRALAILQYEEPEQRRIIQELGV